MKLIDFLKAAGVGLGVMALTVAASFPMIFIYATFIEPGHPQAFYNDAAQWIAPWSSHVLGPILFLVFNFWMARRKPERNAIAFALATIALYVLIDFGMMLPFAPVSAFASPAVALSLTAKLAGALIGAWLGARKRQGA
jgi:low temperature requirement protein LtrA